MHQAEPADSTLGTLGRPGASYTHHALLAGDPVADTLALPASRGVLVMLGERDRPVFMAATGDCRDLARRKLAPAERGVRAGTNLGSIVKSAHVVECASSFEADLVYLLLARRLMPQAARLVAERWRSWWAQIDPDADFPEWSKTDFGGGAVAPRSASTPRGMVRDAHGWILGPFADKDAAGRFIERMIDAFDLCREHRLLVQAPRAQPCPYKEMGRCAAPCDGSETMNSYRARVRDAIELVTGDMEEHRRGVHGAMQSAAAAQDFESAARLHGHSERLAKLAGPATARISRLEDFRFLVVWRSLRPGWARLARCERGDFCWLADIKLSQSGSSTPAADLVSICSSFHSRGSMYRSDQPMTPEQIDVLGLLARERVATDTRRTAWFVPVQRNQPPEVTARSVLRAGASAWKPRRGLQHPGKSTDDGPVHELEAMSEALPYPGVST